MDDGSRLFVARPRQATFIGQEADESMSFRNRTAGLVELCKPGDESCIDVRRCPANEPSLAREAARLRPKSATKPASQT